VSRLPQLEQELVAAAGRLASPKRAVRPAARAAFAIAAVGVALAAAGVVAVVDGGEDPARPAATPPPFPPDATLEDMLGVFRTPATPADDTGFTQDDFNKIGDHQPGEDPTQARRVEWPGASIFMWPMRDGVCYGVPGGGGCAPLDLTRDKGVSVGIHSSSRDSSLYGVVVDGIEEVVVSASDGPDLRVPVRENFFFLDLETAPLKGVQAVTWHYGGEERRMDVARVLDRAAAPPMPPGMDEGEPRPKVEALAESASEPLSFTVAGTRYTAVAFHTSRSLVCISLRDVDLGRPEGQSCLNERLLPEALQERPAHIFAGGSNDQAGYARGDVVEITPRDASSGATVVLSEPWTPEPWEGEPIRFFFVFGVDEPEPGELRPPTPLTVRLSDGQTVQVP
jgi:hypothetical protein